MTKIDKHEVCGKDITTFIQDFNIANRFEVEVGSTEFIEGNNGSRVYIRINSENSNWEVRTKDSDSNLEYPDFLEISLVGGSEYLTFMKALEFILYVMKNQKVSVAEDVTDLS